MKYIILAAITTLLFSCSSPTFSDFTGVCLNKEALTVQDESVSEPDPASSLRNDAYNIRAEMQKIAEAQASVKNITSKQAILFAEKLVPYQEKLNTVLARIEAIEASQKAAKLAKELDLMKSRLECLRDVSRLTLKQAVCAKKAGSIEEFNSCLPIPVNNSLDGDGETS